MYSRQFGFDALIARLFAFVGPHLPLEGYAVGNFIRDALNGLGIRIESDGSTVRSYLYGADMALWLWTILLSGDSLRPYNVGSEGAITVRDLGVKVAAAAAKKASVEVLGRPGVPATRYVPDTTRAQTELGLREHVSLEEALTRALEWHRFHQLQTH
jgi:dTDP-glucose 4,6-dehydratase